LVTFGRHKDSLAEGDRLGAKEIDTFRNVYKFVKRKVGAHGLTGGVHALPLNTTTELIQLLKIDREDVFWEIGCGEPYLAFCLSAAAGGSVVVATDLGEILNSYILSNKTF
jgi:hypothetical protein